MTSLGPNEYSVLGGGGGGGGGLSCIHLTININYWVAATYLVPLSVSYTRNKAK